ncbi:hypothetical protein G6F22_019656 [Rhizopus arrhizus]|nr:hypothetical protein G6F22_019656 [Rhizopus arrhizus]
MDRCTGRRWRDVRAQGPRGGSGPVHGRDRRWPRGQPGAHRHGQLRRLPGTAGSDRIAPAHRCGQQAGAPALPARALDRAGTADGAYRSAVLAGPGAGQCAGQLPPARAHQHGRQHRAAEAPAG